MLKRLILIFFIPFVLWGSDEQKDEELNNYVLQLSNSGDFLKSNVEDVVLLIKKKINNSKLSKKYKIDREWWFFFF